MFDYDPAEASYAWECLDASNNPILFDAELKAVKETVSKKSQEPMLVLKMEVTHPDGRTQTIDDYITRKAVFKLKQLAVAIGKGDEFKSGTFQPENYIGACFAVELKKEEFNGEENNKVQRYREPEGAGDPPGSSPQQPPARAPSRPGPPRQSVGAGRGGFGPRPETAPQEAPYGDEQQFKEDDIPF